MLDAWVLFTGVVRLSDGLSGKRGGVRAGVALSLLVGAYVVLGAVCLVWAVFAVGAVWLLDSRSPVPLLFAAGTLVPLLLLVREVSWISQPAGPRADSVPVTAERAPQLWATINRLSASLGAAPPAELRLTAEAGAALIEDGWLLGLRPGERRLYLGAPLLVGLRPAELEAVIAQELGRFDRRIRFAGPAYRASAALATARLRLTRAMFANGLLLLYAGGLRWALIGFSAIFDGLTSPVRRRQEFSSDRRAASLAGTTAVLGALTAVPALGAVWTRFEAEFAWPLREVGEAPDDPFAAFGCMVDDPEIVDLLASLSSDAASRPAITARMDALAPVSVRRPGVEAYTVDPALLVGLARRASPGWTGHRRPWRAWLGRLAEYQALAAVRPLAATARALAGAAPAEAGTGAAPAATTTAPASAEAGATPGEAVTLGTVLDLLDAHRAPLLARALPAHSLVDAITALVGHGLVEAGAAVWEPAWTGASRMVAVDVDADRLRAWVATAVDEPAQVGWLRLRLAGLRLDPDAVTIPAGPRAASALPGRPGRAKTDPRSRMAAFVSLGVMLTLLACGGLRWLGADESPAPTSSPAVLPSYSPQASDVSPLPDFRVPTLRVPTELVQLSPK